MSLKIDQMVNKESKVKPSVALSNPYIAGSQGRKEWNDRYENLADSVKKWQRAFFCAIACTLVFSGVLAKLAMESRVQPFVVETNNGLPYAIKPMSTMSADDQRIINFSLNQFIINARTVVSDTEAQKTLLSKVYAFSANNTIAYLHDYYEKFNPLESGDEYSISVNIINSLPLSHDTWQITWDETKRKKIGGSSIDVTRWMANITYKFSDINPNFMIDNPFGFYVTNVTWAQSQIDNNKGTV